ncbi:GerAB/ArcD/ProY family transporter [Paenibacillus sp. LMG 31461]|uniref:GerAB/ArcD/ProY family transporter n=1 Tax=Paenibacillus plantarum TaxID=2654975 RepID=A0ABX1X9N7_9BACL|nr:GerAB/ArcD/ProY family transporter [Paenibacillus plantarum]NOU64733.1 GerAB/ArcD/ProY family transporter [Paenibacillus plantarum]
MVEIHQLLYGNWMGKVISIFYIISWLSVTIVILRAMSDFIQLVLFFHTPTLVISIMMILVLTYIVYQGGITAIARFSQIVGPLFLLVIIISLLLNVPNLQVGHLLAIFLDHGALHIAKVSIVHISFLAESILMMMLIPLFSKPEKVGKVALLAVTISSFVVIVTTCMVIMTFGPHLAGKFINPYFNMIRFISILEYRKFRNPCPGQCYSKYATQVFVDVNDR